MHQSDNCSEAQIENNEKNKRNNAVEGYYDIKGVSKSKRGKRDNEGKEWISKNGTACGGDEGRIAQPWKVVPWCWLLSTRLYQSGLGFGE